MTGALVKLGAKLPQLLAAALAGDPIAIATLTAAGIAIGVSAVKKYFDSK